MRGGLVSNWIGEEREFPPLRAEWNALARASGLDSVFLRHEWFDAAWQWLKGSASMRVLCVRSGGALVGVCPLMIVAGAWKGVPIRVARFIEVPDSQACDIISGAADRARVCAELLARLRDIKGEWDVLELEKIPEGSPTLAELPAILRGLGLAWRQAPANPNPFIPLEAGWDGYYARRSRRLRKGNNLIRNHLQKDYRSIEVERVPSPGSPPERVEEALREIIRISSLSWKRETGLSLDQKGPNAFLTRLTAHAAEQGWLAIWLLSLDGKAVAMEYQVRHGDDVYALRSDFDLAYNEKGPGTYLNMEVLKALFGAGQGRYLMGPGHNPYKLRWAEANAMLGGFAAYGFGLRGRLLGIARLKVAGPLAALRERLRQRPGAAAEPAQGGAD